MRAGKAGTWGAITAGNQRRPREGFGPRRMGPRAVARACRRSSREWPLLQGWGGLAVRPENGLRGDERPIRRYNVKKEFL